MSLQSKFKAVGKRLLSFVGAPKYYRYRNIKKQCDWLIIKESKIKASRGKSKVAGKYGDELLSNGICQINNFLPDPVFYSLVNEIERLKATNNMKRFPNHHDYGVDRDYMILNGNLPSTLEEQFVDNSDIKTAVEYVSGRKLRGIPRLAFEGISVSDGRCDDVDINLVNHADRPFHTVKAFFYLNDVFTSEDGPFMYARESNKLDVDRMEYERRSLVVRENMNSYTRSGSNILNSNKEINWVTNGRVTPPPSLYPRFIAKPVYAPKNTLILCDTFGFHSRGKLSIGRSRNTLRLVYHYVHSLSLMQILMCSMGYRDLSILN